MTDDAAALADLEQMTIASEIMVGLLRLTLKHPEAMDRETVAKMLMMAADERDRQGDYGAAKLLDDWAEKVGEPMGMESDVCWRVQGLENNSISRSQETDHRFR